LPQCFNKPLALLWLHIRRCHKATLGVKLASITLDISWLIQFADFD
jgi:hypothetical protein